MRGFAAVAVEADWPDAYRVNRYVQGVSSDSTSVEALSGFKRFPAWMWRNADVLDFVGWLRSYNDSLSRSRQKIGFYGLDLYSLFGSIEAILHYLQRVDRPAANRARYRYSCFEHFGEDSQAYGYAASFDLSRSCEDEVVEQLIELQRHATDYSARDGRAAQDEFFYAEQNARLVKNAEQYYRSMFRGQAESWNLRDRHMAETIAALAAHLQRHGSPSKIVIWEHNSHIGDARATEMGEGGELNVGQLIRERYGNKTALVGFSTYSGSVTAASNWGEPAERKPVLPALPESYEACFHETGIPRFFIIFSDNSTAASLLRPWRLERAIGVIYLPRTERISHYFNASLPKQFDALIHLDTTRAVEPLERTSMWETGEAPETYPAGM